MTVSRQQILLLLKRRSKLHLELLGSNSVARKMMTRVGTVRRRVKDKTMTEVTCAIVLPYAGIQTLLRHLETWSNRRALLLQGSIAR